MNIFLMPYTWHRHFAMALWCGGFGVLAWWGMLTLMVTRGFPKNPWWDGPFLLMAIASTVAAASMFGEGNLMRQRFRRRLWRTLLAGLITTLLVLLGYTFWHYVVLNLIFSGLAEDAVDTSLVSLRFRIGAFGFAGVSTALGPLILRREGWIAHLGGGAAAGLLGGAVWFMLGREQGDLYLAGVAMGFVWGFTFGLAVWGIPDRLYAGWLRVRTPARVGRRIPLDTMDGAAKERFIGHFPRGLDLFLPVEDGVNELHLSVSVNEDQVYKARGLTLHPTTVKRFLEKVDLRYDTTRPAPLETQLESGDRIRMQTGDHFSEIEFIMLPREEQ